jgi:hypothetical protein
MEFKMKQFLKTLFISAFIAMPLFAQGHGHGSGGHHGMWPDSLETITLTGNVIIDSTHFMPMYYLDVNKNNEADYHLSFGPYWYEPASGATFPNEGDNISIVGSEWGHEFDEPTVVVYEINGLEWRESIEGNKHGWDGDHFWGDNQNQVTVTGSVLIDSTYYFVHFFLDENNDGAPEYMLNFGPPWHLDQNVDSLPNNGDVVTITGDLHEEMMMDIPSLMVYEINGQEWRNHDGPPPWSGNWLFRNGSDTGFVFCPTDSLDWMQHPPGSMMGNMMGGGLFPDSVYCQFEELYPDHLPGEHDSTLFAGYYMDMYDPAGQTMMSNGGMMGGMRGMRFNQPTNFRFHYDENHLSQMRLSDEEIHIKYWDENNSMWVPINAFQVDADNNLISFQNENMYNYYALFGAKITTNITRGNTVTPDNFNLYQNYPNPFNPETTIRFEVPNQSAVTLNIYNVLGQQIKSLLSGTLEAGAHQILWDGSNDFSSSVPSGIYFAQLTYKNKKQTIKMNLIR